MCARNDHGEVCNTTRNANSRQICSLIGEFVGGGAAVPQSGVVVSQARERFRPIAGPLAKILGSGALEELLLRLGAGL